MERGSHSPSGLPAHLERSVQDLVTAGAVPIPPYPAVALRVKQAAVQKNVGLAEISRLVRSDGALAADLLRCANSPIYRRGSPVTTLNQAVTRVGAREVVRLALASSLASHAYVPGPLASLRRLVWLEGMSSALVCQELARLRGLDPEEAFVAGLLHDFGKVIACSCLERIARESKLEGQWPLAAWSQVVERLHVTLGLELASRWRLPSLVVEMVAAHHGEPGAGGDGLLEVVKVSDAVVSLLSCTPAVAAPDLASIGQFASEGEREAIARVVPSIPEFVASFEPAEVRETTSGSAVRPAESPPVPGSRAVSFPLEIRAARRAHQCTVVAIGANGVVATGQEPFPEGRLLETTLRCQPQPLAIWVIVRSCQPDRDGFRLELQPYALSGEERAAWDRLLEGG
ncbi:MAG TPA: HDOD domain-containing protein [Myxococcota bacterium]|nr:HDOD domain-containing protein [Myxococcota bacterium]